MRTIVVSDLEKELAALVSEDVAADYVYAYPPRQAYGPVDQDELSAAVSRSLARRDALNIYVHVPFCEQICAFCNLYAVVGHDEAHFERYVDTVIQEAATYARDASGTKVETLYIGGGTPSQLSGALIDRLIGGLEREFKFDRGGVAEVAIEMAPDTVSAEHLADYRRAGITRVNLGLQTTDDAELRSIGRRRGVDAARGAISIALEAGFTNVCVDLIYGLRGQSERSWERSVQDVISLGPQTICAYALTLRPRTGYAARGYHSIDVSEQYRKYDYADVALREAGYVQETHVRWSQGPNGGYLQKANHWALGCVVGLGAGARGYLWHCDYRNGYSARHRKPVLRQWFDQVERVGHGRTDGFLMGDDERERKALILGLHDLNRRWAREQLGVDPTERFTAELALLASRGLLTLGRDAVQLTRRGMRHRDVLVQPFVSERVHDALAAFDYDDD